MIWWIALFLVNANAVDFVGVPESLKNKLSHQIEIVNSKPTSYDQVDKLIIDLMESQLFESVEADISSDGRLQISAKPVRKIANLNIIGSHAMSQNDIQKYLQVNVGSNFDRKNLFEAAQRLKDRYSELGHMNTVITADFKPGPDNSIGININIEEGPECFVKKLSTDVANPFIGLRLGQMAKKFIGRRFTSDILSEFSAEVNEFFVTNRYLNASLSTPKMEFNVDSSQVYITYQVNDPYRVEFLFKGNKAVSDEELIHAIEPQTMSQLGFNLTTEAGLRVRDKYLNMGYAKVAVTTVVRQVDESFRREILFTVEEGPRVTIRKLYILGQISRQPQYYSDFVFEHSSDLVSRGYYNERDMERGYKNLITELRNQGFFRARIQSSSVIDGPGNAWVDLQISIYEGPLTEIEKITFTGNKAFTSAELEAALSVKTDGPLHLNKLEESIDKLRQFYLSHGYLEMQIMGGGDSLVSYNKTNTRASINFNVQEGPKVTVNAIIVDGNDQTRNSVILRELDFQVGDTLAPENINSSIYALQRLGLFGKIEIDTFEKGTTTGPRTVIVKVSERNPGLFRMGLGVNNEYNLNARGYVGVSYRNLFGSAQSLSLRLDQNKAIAPLEGQKIELGSDFLENKVTAGYYVPYLIRPHIDFRLNLTRSQSIIQHPNHTENILFTDVQESNSADFLLEKNFGKRIKLIWTTYGFSQDKKFHVGDNPRAEENIARIGPTVDFDYRDDPFNPTKGSFLRLNFDYSDPTFGSSNTIKFVRTTTTVSHFLPIKSSGWVWANSVRGGFVKNLATGPYLIAFGNPTNNIAPTLAGIPYQELFTLGTRSTIRGFNPVTELIPRIDEIKSELANRGIIGPNDTLALTDFKVDGETSFYLIKSELRFPLFGPVGGVVFYDGGAVIIPGFPMEDPYRDSAGFGIRFITPVGPVNFELAYKLDPKTNSGYQGNYTESKYQFHFSIGSF